MAFSGVAETSPSVYDISGIVSFSAGLASWGPKAIAERTDHMEHWRHYLECACTDLLSLTISGIQIIPALLMKKWLSGKPEASLPSLFSRFLLMKRSGGRISHRRNKSVGNGIKHAL